MEQLAGAVGLEPTPSSLTVRCPTNWTTPQPDHSILTALIWEPKRSRIAQFFRQSVRLSSHGYKVCKPAPCLLQAWRSRLGTHVCGHRNKAGAGSPQFGGQK